jgi:hypothetical protein
MPNCICCGKPAEYSIQLAVGPNEHGHAGERYYLPNASVRDFEPNIPMRWFCHRHMRAVEDSVRATIAYHQLENGVPPLPLKDPS